MKIIILLIFTILIILLSACDNNIETSIPPEAIEITASQLYAEYQANEIAADLKYDDKMLKVTGVINHIGVDILGSAYIVLTGGGEYELWGVQCTFPNIYEPWIATLNAGQYVRITGKCKGYLLNVLVEVD